MIQWIKKIFRPPPDGTWHSTSRACEWIVYRTGGIESVRKDCDDRGFNAYEITQDAQNIYRVMAWHEIPSPPPAPPPAYA